MKKIFWAFIVLFNVTLCYSQKAYKISGYVKDSLTHEALIGATVVNVNTGKGVVTDNYGFYSISVTLENQKVRVSFVGFRSEVFIFPNHKDTLINIYLSSGQMLSEITIQGNVSSQLISTQVGVEKIDAKTVNSLPVILGESDLLRTVQLLPGVIMGTEGSLGYNVRGGSNDQNMILIDGVPIYSAYHMYGLFSIVNTDAINDAKLLKGGFSPQYGGRLSSILDIQMREGNSQKYSREFDLGIFASKLTFEGPVFKDKTSFIITGRRSMTDIMPHFVYSKQNTATGLDRLSRDINLPSYYFYDINIKINHTFSKRNRLFFNFYKGNDNFDNNKKAPFPPEKNYLKNWGNTLGSVRWNYIINNGLFSNITAYFTHYSYFMQEDNIGKGEIENEYLLSFNTEIKEFSVKSDFGYTFSNHTLKFGAQYSQQDILPGVKSMKTNLLVPIDTTYNFGITANIFSAYMEDTYSVSSRFTVSGGIHLNGFKLQSVFYPTFQPRLSLNYRLNETISIKGAYSRMAQNIHQLSQTVLGAPEDLWVPSASKTKPALSDIYVFSYNQELKKGISFTSEIFYKNMKNLIMYKEGASYMTEVTDWQELTETGTGKSYGIEFSIKKGIGKTQGWVSYTLSKSVRHFDNINRGIEFPFIYDRTHNLAIAIMHKLGKKWDLGADWVYYTGNPATLTNMVVKYDAGVSSFFGLIHESVNGYRLPSYHRLDVGLSYNGKIGDKITSKLTLGAYNLYSRKNPYFILIGLDGVTRESLFGILPYVNYSIKF